MAATNKSIGATAEVAPVPEKKVKLRPEEARKRLIQTYKSEPLVSVVLAPQYAVHFGNIMRVSINGISIQVKVDGSTQKVPKTFASEIHRRRRAIDAQLMKMKRLSNIPKNGERSPGELTI